MSKAWGGVGAWALDAERAEAEELAANAAAASAKETFPSLKEAASTKSKKKKPASMSLAEFAAAPTGPSPDVLLRLPTGPRPRSPEELQNARLGGGFRSYGHGGGSGSGRRGDEGDEQRRRSSAISKVSDFDQPSRADEVDNWAAAKKPSSGFGDSGRRDRYGSLGSGGSSGGGLSRADDVDNWYSGKKPLQTRTSSVFGSGFRDGSWGGRGPALSNNEERPKLVFEPPKGGGGGTGEAPARTRPSPFGAARPREEVLAEKGMDWRKIESEIEVKGTSRPGSAHSSRPSSAHSSRAGSPGSQAGSAGEGGAKPRPKVNPFGDAKPREVLLQEQGKDWRKIDFELEHRRVDRPETHEEKLLKEEICVLKKTLTKEVEGNVSHESAKKSSEELAQLKEHIAQRERDLELLTHELDDKVRFGQRASGGVRPGSSAGRTAVSLDRPPSQSGHSDESRNLDVTERPQLHGAKGDVWTKPMEESCRNRGARESSFFGSGTVDRSRSRERW